MADWFYTRQGQKFGPVSSAELKRLAESGGLLRTDSLWKEGMKEWTPVRTVKGLFPPASSAASLPTPPPLPPLPADTKRFVVGGLFQKFKADVPKWLNLFTRRKALASISLFAALLLVVLLSLWAFSGSAVPIAMVVNAFAANKTEAEARYSGKIMTIRGVIKTESDDKPDLECDDMTGCNVKGLANAEFRVIDQAYIRTLKRGTEITFRGRCSYHEMKSLPRPPQLSGDFSDERRFVVTFLACELLTPRPESSHSVGQSNGHGRSTKTPKKKASDLARTVSLGMSRSEVADLLGSPDVQTAVGLGEACLFNVLTSSEAVFVAFDRNGRVMSVQVQRR